MKRSWAFLITILLGIALLGPAGPATAAAPFCGIYWGSLPKQATTMSTAHLVNVRSGQHACYDRLVLDVDARINGYTVQYVTQVQAEGSGFVVPLRGGARLSVHALVPAYNDAGAATYNPANTRELTNVAGYRTFRQVAWAGSFEGTTTIGLGVRARLPFRVFILDGPGTMSRLVIDVAHRW